MLGEILLAEGLLSAEDLAAALAYRRENGVKLGQALVELRMLDEADLAGALRRQGRVECIDLTPGMVDPDVARELGEERSRQLGAVAVNRIADVVTVALEDPDDAFTVEELALHLDGVVLPVHAEPSRIQQCLECVFGARDEATRDLQGLVEQARALPAGADDRLTDRLARRFVDRALLEAARAGATELHFEPREAGGLVLRLRVDGALCERARLPLSLAAPCARRLATLAELDASVHRLPQSGAARTTIDGRERELSVSTLPTRHGDEVVVRFATGPEGLWDWRELGLDREERHRLERLLARREGLILASGPARSGKGATLRALLGRALDGACKGIALEDGFEGQVPGATHVRVDPAGGLTWARGVRAALELDPEVLFVEELRDSETACLAAAAALRGRLVLTGLRCDDAAAALRRLGDLGLEAFVLADIVRGVVAQRLVRLLCPTCKRPATVDARDLDLLGVERPPAEVFEAGGGCEECHGTGYRGRAGVFEVVELDDELASLFARGADARTCRAAFRRRGFRSLRERAVDRVLAGQTSMHEVFGVALLGDLE